MEPLKRCSKCGTERPLGFFSKNRRERCGYSGQCKICARAYYLAHRTLAPPREKKVKVCRCCSQPLLSWNERRSVYCADCKVKRKARQTAPRICKRCGTEYPSTHRGHDHIFCPSCLSHCARCGVPVEPYRGRKYCAECKELVRKEDGRASYRRRLEGKPMLCLEPRNCAECGKTFVPGNLSITGRNRGAKAKQKYCCSECKGRAASRRLPFIKSRARGYRSPHSRREYTLRSKYGLTFEKFQEMIFYQEGKCTICGRHQDEIAGKHPLVVDHDHANGKVRALVCNRCNTLVGYIENHGGLLDKARAYIERHKTIRVAESA